MSYEPTTASNSVKLDRLLFLIEGEGQIMSRVHVLEKTLFGEENKGGLYQQHQIMWRIHVWVLCSLSGLVGSALTMFIQYLIKHI